VDVFSHLAAKVNKETIAEGVVAIICEWYDTYDLVEPWNDYPLTDDYTQPLLMRTMGYLLVVNDMAITVAGTLDVASNVVSQVTVIPRGCIKTITEL
jgi:quinol-cytochrome oxidoreductase complex cytochrome b subunit